MRSLGRTIPALITAAIAALVLAACGGSVSPGKAAVPGTPVTVFAASSLTDVMKDIGAAYAGQGHPSPVFNFAGTSELARQIENGAQADVFVSADEAWMNELVGKGMVDTSTRKTLLTNKLVLVSPADRPLRIEPRQGMALAAALRGGRLALADPDSVPAGRYAQAALKALDEWTSVEPLLVRTENVRAALRFVETGEAAAGVVYATDAKAAGDRVFVSGGFPEGSHPRITYPAAVLTGKRTPETEAFLDFLTSPAAGAVFKKAGFGLPAGSPAGANLPPS